MAMLPESRVAAEMGICVSGGGVRSATVTLGALQSLREERQLEQSSYLVSVSGGGYMSGAFQLALTSAGRPDAGVGWATPEDVFAPGSVEEDHVRRHSSYLADNPGQWLNALGILLRNLVGSLILLGLAVTVTGIAIGRFYHSTLIADVTKLRPLFLLKGCPPDLTRPNLPPAMCHPLAPFPAPPWGVTLALGAVVGVALVLYVIPLLMTLTAKPETRLRSTGAAILSLGAFLGTIGVALPGSVWASAWVSYHIGHANRGQIVSAGAATAVLSYIGSLAAILWRNKKPIGQANSLLSKKVQGQVLPKSMVQSILIWICLLVLCVALLLASGWVASDSWVNGSWALLPIAVLGVVGVVLDQTQMSLHPFYRRRLATAFAVRRVERNGQAGAEPLGYDELTKLSQYARREPAQEGRARHPRVIFAASANINGEDLTPPGRSVVSFTMAADYVGGSQLGWVPTAELEALVKDGRLSRDLTVEAAVAISGAAFASAMGRQTRFYEVFLCLSNARLGAWLPNPRYVWLKKQHESDWTFPGLPSRRRLNCLAREIFGVHPGASPLVLCTDGGHYENLGLVELLRHKCRIIYCIDATGDTPPMATTLAQAITLAWEELGVKITLRNPGDLVPGAADPLIPPLSDLNARLSSGVVCVADIEYPGDPITFYKSDGTTKGSTSRSGTLIVAKTSLTPDTPYNLLSFAREDKFFPRDSTGDQWFNGDQFDAYHQLGKFMGDRAVQAAKAAKVIDQNGKIIP